MSENDQDKLNDLDLEALYAEGRVEAPPAELDAAILEVAAKKHERPRGRGLSKLAPGLASAAVVLLTLGVVMNQDQFSDEQALATVSQTADTVIAADVMSTPPMEEIELAASAPAPVTTKPTRSPEADQDSAFQESRAAEPESQIQITAKRQRLASVMRDDANAQRRVGGAALADAPSAVLEDIAEERSEDTEMESPYRLEDPPCDETACALSLRHSSCSRNFELPISAEVIALNHQGLRYELDARRYRVTCSDRAWQTESLPE